MRSESFWSASKEGAGVYRFGEYTGPSGTLLVAGGVVVGGAGVYLFGKYTGEFTERGPDVRGGAVPGALGHPKDPSAR